MSTWYVMSDSLSHYGVKGMKWGVRKDKTKSSSRSFSLSDNQKKWVKRGAILAGTALAAYGGYKLYKYTGNKPSTMLTYGVSDSLKTTLNMYPSKDITIKSGQTLQRVSKDSFENFKDRGHTYVSYKFRDNARYKSGFRKEINLSGSRDFVHKIKPEKNLKIASPNTVAREYLKKYPDSSDQTFRMVVSPYGQKKGNDDLSNLLNSRRESLFSDLKKQGYSGIVDIEDASKHRGSSPLILFNPDNYIKNSKSRKIGKIETFVSEVIK